MNSEECLTFEAKPWKGSLRSRSNSASDDSYSDNDCIKDRFGPQPVSSPHYKMFCKVTLDMTQLAPRSKFGNATDNTKDLLRVMKKAKNGASKRRSPLFNLWDGQEAPLSTSAHQSEASQESQDEDKERTRCSYPRESETDRTSPYRQQQGS